MLKEITIPITLTITTYGCDIISKRRAGSRRSCIDYSDMTEEDFKSIFGAIPNDIESLGIKSTYSSCKTCGMLLTCETCESVPSRGRVVDADLVIRADPKGAIVALQCDTDAYNLLNRGKVGGVGWDYGLWVSALTVKESKFFDTNPILTLDILY